MLVEVLKLRQKWQDSVNAHSIGDVMECYDREAVFKGTVNGQFSPNNEGIRDYFEVIFKKHVSVRFIGMPKIRQFGDTYIDYGDYEFCVDRKVLRAKYAFTYLDGDTPKIISHLSYKII